jgi:hypothetical protein
MNFASSEGNQRETVNNRALIICDIWRVELQYIYICFGNVCPVSEFRFF